MSKSNKSTNINKNSAKKNSYSSLADIVFDQLEFMRRRQQQYSRNKRKRSISQHADTNTSTPNLILSKPMRRKDRNEAEYSSKDQSINHLNDRRISDGNKSTIMKKLKSDKNLNILNINTHRKSDVSVVSDYGVCNYGILSKQSPMNSPKYLGNDLPNTIFRSLSSDLTSIFDSKANVVFTSFVDREKAEKLMRLPTPAQRASIASTIVMDQQQMKQLEMLSKQSIYNNNETADSSLTNITNLDQKVLTNSKLSDNILSIIDGSNNSTTYRDSVCKLIVELINEAESDTEYIKKALILIFSTVARICLLCILLIMPVIMVFVGVNNLEDCPKQPKLPVYLLVGGCFGIVKLLQTIWAQWRINRKEKFDHGDIIDMDGYEVESGVVGGGRAVSFSNSSLFMDIVISGFLLIWFIYGNFLTFQIWVPNFRRPLNDVKNWCSKDVFMYSVVHIFTCYLLFILFLFVIFIIYMYKKCYLIMNHLNDDKLMEQTANASTKSPINSV